MYKPHTIDQFKIVQSLKEQGFVMDHFILSPLSRSALLVEDRVGERLAFSLEGGAAAEIPIPAPAEKEAVRAFVREFREDPNRPALHNFEEITSWWLSTPNPLSYQQALGIPDDLYCHFLTHAAYDEKTVRELAARGKMTAEEYLGIELWYLDGNASWCWLGPLGVDGTGEFYGLTFHYGRPDAEPFKFYRMDDYYRFMNRLE